MIFYFPIFGQCVIISETHVFYGGTFHEIHSASCALLGSLAILCNGATVVLSEAVSSGVVLQCNITGGLSALETKINAQTSSDAVRSLVKALFGIM